MSKAEHTTPETAERPRLRALFEAMKRRGLADDGDWDCMTKEELDSFGDALDEALAHSETVRRKVPNVILGLGPQRNDDYATPRTDSSYIQKWLIDGRHEVVLSEFARQLERELEEAKDAEARTREKLEDLYEAGTRSAGVSMSEDVFQAKFDCHYDGDINRCDKDCKQLGECKRRTTGTQSAIERRPTHWYCADCDEFVRETCKLCPPDRNLSKP